MAPNPGIDVFDQDARNHGGYGYTTRQQLSARLATDTTVRLILSTCRFEGRSVLDLGCGDGFFTLLWWDLGHPSALVGIDGAAAAIAVANERKDERLVRFEVGDAHSVRWPDNSFDAVLLQSILHHDDNPVGILREALRLAPEVFIHEPNGNNPGLKLFERVMPYHRAHHEKSYSSRDLETFVRLAGGRVENKRLAGFVPMFVPDPVARLMKRCEPIVERTPGLNAIACAVTVVVAHRAR